MSDDHNPYDFLDRPEVLATLFYPRRATPISSPSPIMVDGRLPVADGVALGYRLYTPIGNQLEHIRGLLLFFHGNGEVAPDYDWIAPGYLSVGLVPLVVDYRGYGWSDGQPTVRSLIEDVAPVVEGLPALLAAHKLDSLPWLVKGRSLGSAPAIHAVHTFPERFKGLIIESGFARATNLLNRLGMDPHITATLPDPVGNDRKLGASRTPLLILHGTADQLLPFQHAEDLLAASIAENKRLVPIRGAGHNDLLMVGEHIYFEAIGGFVGQVVGQA